MAFIASPETYARMYAFRHAQDTLTAYLQGRERLYAVRDAVNEIKALFGAGAVQPAALIAQAVALDPDDEDGRAALVTRALDLIGRQVRADRTSTE